MSLIILAGLLYGSYWLCHNDHRRTCTPKKKTTNTTSRNTSRRHDAGGDGEGKEDEER